MARQDPLRGFRFLLEIDAIANAGRLQLGIVDAVESLIEPLQVRQIRSEQAFDDAGTDLGE